MNKLPLVLSILGALCCWSGCGGGGTTSIPPPSQGSLTVTITSLPSGTSASVTVSGPNGYNAPLTSSQTLQLAPGTYTVTANPVTAGSSHYSPAVMTQTATVSTSTPASVTVDYSTIIPTTTKVLDSAGMSSLSISPDGSTITMSTSSAVAASLAAGDVLASAPAPAAEYGLLVKILSVSTSGATVTSSVQQATLEDAIQQGTLQFTETLGPSNTTPNVRAKGNLLPHRRHGHLRPEDSNSGACAGNPNKYPVPFNVPLAEAGGASLTVMGEDDFCPTFNFALQMNGFQIVSMTATVTTGLHTSVGLLDSVEESFNYTQNLQALKGPITTAYIGIGPLIGVVTGHWLKSNRTAAQLIGGMTFFGILGVLGGELWNGWFPINKHMWTSSFVLFSGGFCLLFLSLVYWATEVRRWRGRWTMPILVFGMNAIAGFVADALIYGPGYTFTVTTESGTKMNWHEAAQAHLEAVGLSVANASLVYSLGALLICWIMLWLLWRKKIFLKV